MKMINTSEKKFLQFRCPNCSWKILFTLCIFCISVNLLLLNVYLSFLYPLIHPEAKDCTQYKRDEGEQQEKVDKFAKLTGQPNWFAVANHTYIYSAYHSKCPSKFSSSKCIQFIGITFNATVTHHKINPDICQSTTYYSTLKCGFRNGSMVFNAGLAFVELLPEGHNLPYTATFFYCRLKNGSFPEYATVFEDEPIEWFPVEKIIFKQHFQSPNLSLCVRPLYGHFSKLFLLQFFSYYSSEGVDQFILYHHNTSESTIKFLNSVADVVRLKLLPWDIPLSKEEVHEYGQIAFTQDCLSRTRYKYSHTLLLDLDEFLVPKEHRTLIELVTHLDAHYLYAGSFIVSSVLFCSEFQISSSVPALHHNKRQKTPWEHGYRSKYIARPHRLRYGGIHRVWGLEDIYYEVNVPPSMVMLHHYKPCCGMQQTWFFHLFSFNVLDDKVVTDNSLFQNSENFNKTLHQFMFTLKEYFQ